jgi:hypothetical protein
MTYSRSGYGEEPTIREDPLPGNGLQTPPTARISATHQVPELTSSATAKRMWLPWTSLLQCLGIGASKPGALVPDLPPTPPPTPVKETKFSLAKYWFSKLQHLVARNRIGPRSSNSFDEELTFRNGSMSFNGDNTKPVGEKSHGELVKSADNFSILANTTAPSLMVCTTSVLLLRKTAAPTYVHFTLIHTQANCCPPLQSRVPTYQNYQDDLNGTKRGSEARI